MPEQTVIDKLKRTALIKNYLTRIFFAAALVSVLLVIYDIGFEQPAGREQTLRSFYMTVLAILAVLLMVRYFFTKRWLKLMFWPFDLLFVLFVAGLWVHHAGLVTIEVLRDETWMHLFIFYIFLRELSGFKFKLNLNPAQMFLAGFLTIILLGTLLLMLPNATHTGISPVDALFTSTSAVCVTGLIVVDTGSFFTPTGQIILLLLIQVGGIGIMTFTSYFSYFFKGRVSYESQLILRDVGTTSKVGDVLSTLKKIILFTFAIEAVGAIFIFASLDAEVIPATGNRIFFSVFHSVSGFCNAGFSTLSESLYAPAFRFNYSLHLIIAFLFILGGIGFPIVFNFFLYLKYAVMNLLFRRKKIYLHWVLSINTRIVVVTTLALLVVGTAGFYTLEYHNTLADHRGWGKMVTAFFGAATPRTAGFNTVNTSALSSTTLLFVIFLMWVGASPSSTGGGIKTSAFAVGVLNFFSISKGMDRIEAFRREISDMTVRRAFAIIVLSLLVIGVSILLLSFFEPDKKLMAVAFESFSAFSTVGLSMGITGELSVAGKLVLVITMFVGRVSMLTILIAFLRRVRYLQYRYPSESIYIN